MTLATLLVSVWLKIDQARLHTMVNSQQSKLNDALQLAEGRASTAEGRLAGVASEQQRVKE